MGTPSALPAQGFAKGYVYCDTSPSFIGYNVSGVVKNGTGDYTVTWANAFATTTYTAVCTPKFTSGSGAALIANISNANFTTTTCRVLITDLTGTLADPNEFLLVAFEA